jgi:hypothetical protein
MASKAHQMILGLVARKMRQRGYEIVSFDGNENIISNISLSVTPTIKRHKPDIIGVNFKTKKICLGDAKTLSDIDSLRTKEQFTDYSNLVTKNKKTCEFIIGIPKSAEQKLLKILQELGINEKNKNVSYVWMPDELLPEEND